MNKLEIKGAFATAVCYAKVIDDDSIEQIQRMCNYALTENSNVRIMPDVHAGNGCTIGTTMTVTDKVCPNIVGVDIGCGMYTVRLADKNIDFEKVDKVCHYIPSGFNVWEEATEKFDLTKLRCFNEVKDKEHIKKSLGTLGGGNHFIEIDKGSDNSYYLVIHSGSRSLGQNVAKIYQSIAIDLHAGKMDYHNKQKELIDTYIASGRSHEIQAALDELKRIYAEKVPDIPEDICWLYGSYLDDYLHDVDICQRFACKSREKMAEIILNESGLTQIEAFHTIHNYIDTREMILRKGAISAHKNERVLIPINMRDGSVIAIGKGNPEWNYSAPHGAGRILSRKQAKQELNIEAYKEAMAEVYTTCVNEATLDEAPMAYKSLNDIIDVIRDSVDIVDIVKPVYNFKACDSDVLYRKNANSNPS